MLLLVALLGSFLGWGCGASSDTTSPYTNTRYGYSLRHNPTLRDVGEVDYAAKNSIAQLLDDKSFVADEGGGGPLDTLSISVRVMANPALLTLTEYAAQHPATLGAAIHGGEHLALSNASAFQQVEDGTALRPDGTYQVVTYVMSTDRADRAFLIIGRTYAAAAFASRRADYDLIVESFRLNAARASRAANQAIYLSIGDGIQYGCCGDPARSSSALFRRYLASRLVRPVEWVTLANSDPAVSAVTTDGFINSDRAHKSQLQLAVNALREYRRERRPVAAITLSIGGNDLVEVGNACKAPPCFELYDRVRSSMAQRLGMIYGEISAAKDPSTPLFVLSYYNASDCGQHGVDTSPTELGVRGWNATIVEVATRHGLFVVDGYTPIHGRACEFVRNLDLTSSGHAVIAKQYVAAYQALPAAYVAPFDRSPHPDRWATLGVVAVVVVLIAGLAVITKRSARPLLP